MYRRGAGGGRPSYPRPLPLTNAPSARREAMYPHDIGGDTLRRSQAPMERYVFKHPTLYYAASVLRRKAAERPISSRPFMPSSIEIQPENPAASRTLKIAG